MILGAPQWLWLLPVVGLGFIAGLWSWRARMRVAKDFGRRAHLEHLQSGNPTRWRIAKGILVLTGLALTVLALARPQYGSRSLLLRKRGIDIVIALDFSKSMLAQDVRPSRIERAKAEVMQLIEELGGDRVGIVAFAGDTIEFPMTTDYTAIRLFFRDLNPFDMPVGGTAIGRALTAAQHMLEQSREATKKTSQPDQAVILITDGEDHAGEPLEAAKALHSMGAKLFVVGIGSRTPERIPLLAPDGSWAGYLNDEEGKPVTTSLTSHNETQLKQLAKATGGTYFRAGHGSAGIHKIRQQIHRMKQSDRDHRRVTQHEDRYIVVLIPAFLLLVLEGLLPEAWLRSRRQTHTFTRPKGPLTRTRRRKEAVS